MLPAGGGVSKLCPREIPEMGLYEDDEKRPLRGSSQGVTKVCALKILRLEALIRNGSTREVRFGRFVNKIFL